MDVLLIRFKSECIDLILFSFLSYIIISFLYICISTVTSIIDTHPKLMSDLFIISTLILLTIFMYMREFRGISIGRKIFKYKIIDSLTGLQPNKIKSFIKALLSYFMIFDIFAAIFITDNKTVSDVITNTELQFNIELNS